MDELLSLKWNNHRSTFLHILTILRDKQLYTDATLACEGRFYSVHRLVLSTCSDYFSAMFDRTTCKNPIIVLKDIKCEDLEALLDYMYLGEVNVRQADLASLIKAAECLRVKGLAVPDDEPPNKRGRGDTSNLRRSDGASSPPSKRKRREEAQDGREDVRPNRVSSRPKTPQSQPRLSPLPPQENLGTESSSNNRIQQPSMEPSAVDGQNTQIKVEMEDTGGGDDIGGSDLFNINDDSFKEEAKDDQGGDLSNDLPEFMQQSGDGSYSHSIPGPSFQPDLQNWQGDQVLSSNSFSGMGFPSQPQEGSQNTSGDAEKWEQILEGNVRLGPLPEPHRFEPPSFSTPQKSETNTPSSPWNRTAERNPTNTPSSPWNRTAERNPNERRSRHTNCRPRWYSCRYCNRAFNNPKDCRRHMIIHSGAKPFACPFCDHKANLSYNLKRHIFNKHPALL